MPELSPNFRSTTLVVFVKELRESMRDRRSLYAILLSPMLGAGLLFAMVQQSVDRSDKTKEQTCHVQGIERAPHLAHALKLAKLKLEPVSKARAQAFLARDKSANSDQEPILTLLQIPKDFDEDLAVGEPAQIRLSADLSNDRADHIASRIQGVLSRYSSELGTKRLMARGVSPTLMRPLKLYKIDLATARQKSSRISAMMLMFGMIATVTGGMYAAIDCTAGERERRSLESLLGTPAPSFAICLGKWLAVVTMAMATTLLTVLVLGQALLLAPLDELGLIVRVDPATMLGVVGLMLPLAMLMGAVELLLSTFARSYREAQTYLTLLIVIPMLPDFVYDETQTSPSLGLHTIPGLGQHLQATNLIRGEGFALQEFLLSLCVCSLLCALILKIWAQLLRRESIVYGG